MKLLIIIESWVYTLLTIFLIAVSVFYLEINPIWALFSYILYRDINYCVTRKEYEKRKNYK